jgi:hypothetical protein
VFNGSGGEDFLYCLPDNKEISVSREIGRSFGFPKLEDGLSVLSKDKLADSLAYNSIKPLFVSAFRSFWPPKAAADCQTLSFSVSFYKIRLGKNHSKST